MEQHNSIKYGGRKVLRWDLSRPLGVTEAEVRIAAEHDGVLVLTKTGQVEDDQIVALEILPADFGVGKLQPGEWKVEIRPGEAIHPDDIDKPFGRLVVLDALDGPP